MFLGALVCFLLATLLKKLQTDRSEILRRGPGW